MPTSEQLIRAYKLNKPTEIWGFLLTYYYIKHNVITRFKHYKFNLELVFESIPEEYINFRKFSKTIKNILSEVKIVKSSYGKPYKCIFNNIEIDENKLRTTVYVSAVCDAFRI